MKIAITSSTLIAVLALGMASAQAASVGKSPIGASLQWPATLEQRPTTAGSIYLTSLDSGIVAARRVSTTPNRALRLASDLYHRFKITGQLKDAEDALALLAPLAVAKSSLKEKAVLLQARILAGFHEFDAAQKLLSQVREGKTKAAQLLEISIARGIPSTTSTVTNGALDYRAEVGAGLAAFDKGQLFSSNMHLYLAQQKYRDSSPYPLAWIHLQQGIVFLRMRQFEQAKVFFEAAHHRLPEYYLATEHLAETEFLLGNFERAAELYQQVSAQTGQPQFYFQLAKAEAALGRVSASREAADAARVGFLKFTAKYPLAAGHHAVDYYIQIGQADKALVLARQNIDNRKDVDSWLLLFRAALASNNKGEACSAFQKARQSGKKIPELKQQSAAAGYCML